MINLKSIIKKVLNKLETEGYECFLVGGFVRDKLLKKNSYDIDICTNALPKELHKIFGEGSDSLYGTFFLKLGKYNFDITTYRKDIKYENRKPIELAYISDIKEDLLRRDFTINTICMNKNGKIYDYLNGKKDLKNRIIKVVGDNDKKLQEDPLRILRAIRFACTLNFKLDEDLERSIVKNVEYIKSVSKERIKLEFSKIFLSNNFIYGLELLKKLGIFDTLNILPKTIIKSSDLLVMFAQLNLDDKYFTKIENKQLKNIKKIIKYGKIDEVMLFNYGLFTCSVVGEIFKTSRQEINKIYKNMWINESKPLNINASEIMDILNLQEGVLVGEKIHELEILVLEKKLVNEKNKIIEYLKN